MTWNYLSGDAPSSLTTQFGVASFDNNCLNNCTYLRRAVCVNVSLPEYQALVDLYNATSGPSWKIRTGWMSGTDPCYLNSTSTWWGVGCVYGRGQCGRAVRYDGDSEGLQASAALSSVNCFFPPFFHWHLLFTGSSLTLSTNNLSGILPASVSGLSLLTYVSGTRRGGKDQLEYPKPSP